MTALLWSLLLVVANLNLNECKVRSAARPDLSGNSTKTYTVSSLLVEPFLMAREEGHVGSAPEYVGFIPDLLQELEQHMGVNFKIVLTPDKRFGNRQPDGRWDGMVGALTREEVDIAGPLTITSRRHRVMDFSKPFMATGTVLVISGRLPHVAPPGSFTSSVSLIWKPFTAVAWFMLLAATVMVLVFAVIITRLSRGDEKVAPSSVPTLLTTCGGGFSWCLLRVTLGVFTILTLVLYTAGVVSILLYTVRAENNPRREDIRKTTEQMDIVDILQSNQYKIVILRDSASQAFLKHSSVPVYYNLYDRLHYVDNVTDGFDLVLKDPTYGFITDSALVNYYLERRRYCELRKVGTPLNSNGYGLGYPLNSPLYDVINLSILEMRESGLIQMLNRKWWHSRAQCTQPAKPPSPKEEPDLATPSMDGHTVGGVLVVLAIGLILTAVVGVIERVLHYRSDKMSAGRRPLREMDGHPLHIGGGINSNRDLVST